MSSQTRWITTKAEGSLNPAQVETALSEIASRWEGSLPDFLRDFPLGEEALIHLLAISQICAERLQRDPGLLRWLARARRSARHRIHHPGSGQTWRPGIESQLRHRPHFPLWRRRSGFTAIHESRMAQPTRGTDRKIVLRRRTESLPPRSAIAPGGL